MVAYYSGCESQHFRGSEVIFVDLRTLKARDSRLGEVEEEGSYGRGLNEGILTLDSNDLERLLVVLQTCMGLVGGKDQNGRASGHQIREVRPVQ